MNKEVLNYVVEKTKELINASTCSTEAKEAAQAWLASIGSENEDEETKKYINELEEDIVAIDDLIAFAESEHGIKIFGADIAKSILTQAKETKSAGEKYCYCPACAAAEAILKKKNEILG